MKAVQIRKRGSVALTAVHWVRESDPSRTVCGQVLANLNVVGRLELEKLPTTEGCLACDRARAGYARRSPRAQRVVLEPSLGYFSPAHGRGHRILV